MCPVSFLKLKRVTLSQDADNTLSKGQYICIIMKVAEFPKLA